MESIDSGRAVKYLKTDSESGLAIGDVVEEGGVLKVRVNKKQTYIVLGLIGTNSTEVKVAEEFQSSYCWRMKPGEIFPYAAGKMQPMESGSYRQGGEILFKRGRGKVLIKIASGKIMSVSVPTGTFYFFVSLPSAFDEIELRCVSPAEAESL